MKLSNRRPGSRNYGIATGSSKALGRRGGEGILAPNYEVREP
jgi:hypothetical protein